MGIAIIHLGDRLLGVRIELFSGLATFNMAWALDMFFVPFVMGMTVAWIFGRDANHSSIDFRFTQGISFVIWLCYFPPLIVRSLSYLDILYVSGVPEGSSLMPFGLWACFVVMTMVTAGMGEIFGEILIKLYGRKRIVNSAEERLPSAIKEPEL